MGKLQIIERLPWKTSRPVCATQDPCQELPGCVSRLPMEVGQLPPAAGPMRQHGVRLLPGARRGARATAVGSTSESRLLPVGQRGARLPALPCDNKGKGAGDESFNQAAAVCFRAHHQRRGVRHHDRDPTPRIEVIPGYSAVLVLALFGMGEVVVLAQSNYTGQPLWSP
jgi:hypothetical protein